MTWLLAITLLVLLVGPLRPVIAGPQASLMETALAAVAGFVVGKVLAAYGAPPLAPILGMLAFTVAAGRPGTPSPQNHERERKN
jgi:hypothetical protein